MVFRLYREPKLYHFIREIPTGIYIYKRKKTAGLPFADEVCSIGLCTGRSPPETGKSWWNRSECQLPLRMITWRISTIAPAIIFVGQVSDGSTHCHSDPRSTIIGLRNRVIFFGHWRGTILLLPQGSTYVNINPRLTFPCLPKIQELHLNASRCGCIFIFWQVEPPRQCWSCFVWSPLM